MLCAASQISDFSVLASQSDWAWPRALGDIFQPRGVDLIVAGPAGEFVNVLQHRRVHATIVDADSQLGGLATLRLIRMDFPRLPCLMLSSRSGQDLLGQALDLDVFSVIGKPVDMDVLQQQLNRLFIKTYDSDIFA